MIANLAPGTSGTLIETEYRTLDERLSRVRPADLAFDAGAYDPRAIARARGLWLDRMVNEYTSTTVFSQLAAQLVEANASLDTTAVALRMAQDELRHAEICAGVVRALGGDARRPRDTRIAPIARHPGASDEERALRNVIFTTCLSEMNSVTYFVAALERMKDPFLRDVTRRLLADEVLHGRFGFAYLEAWASWLEARPEVRASVGRYLRFAFAVVEREFAAGEMARFTPLPDDDALGVIPPGLAAETFRHTMSEAVVPGLERFGIPAEDAWRRRSLS
ncbi:Hypothetical protein A7982_11774 [Minicystis rosea]|nr:Hypothetical protein A7982_11774 [Minicystis rosea]